MYKKAMYNTAFRICGDEDDAEDVLQESFLSAFRNLKQYRSESSFGAWLKRIVINKAITLIKKKQQISLVEETAAEGVDGTFFYDWDAQDTRTDLTVQRIREAVEELPPGFRSVLTLYLFEGYDHKEIGTILGITESTSKSQYNRAKQKLRELISKEVKYG